MAAALAPFLFAACGSDNASHGGADGGGGGNTSDGQGGDLTSPDVSPADSSGGGSEMAASADAGSLEDVSSEASVDGMQGSDGGAEAAIGATACQTSGDGGDASPSCPAAMTCCGGWCRDLGKDPQNCGSCGNACSSNQFCTGTTCDSAVLKNICANPKATWIADPNPPDNSAGQSIGMALATGCMPAVSLLMGNVNDGVAQDVDSGRPITGVGNTLVAGGGAYGQTSVGYMDSQALTPVLLGTDMTNAWFTNRKTSMNIVYTPVATLTAQHDYFVLELSVEPVSGTLCFFGYGMLGPGTAAAGYYFQNHVIASVSTFTDAWYVYEWTGASDAGTPSAADTFTLIAHGL